MPVSILEEKLVKQEKGLRKYMKIDINKTKRARVKDRIKFKNIRNGDKSQISVFKSNFYTYAILIDNKGKTVKSICSKGLPGKKVETAFKIGESIGKIAIENKLTNIFFNRNGYKYHGRIKAVAEGARKAGIKF